MHYPISAPMNHRVADRLRASVGSILRLILSMIAALAILAFGARACGFDLVAPERAAIDWIVEADDLVIARPRLDNPFGYGVSEVLLGPHIDVALPGLVDSVTRRNLKANPTDGILFARVDGDFSGIAGSEWHMVAYVDETFRQVLDTVMMHRADWAIGYDETRRAFAESLQDIPAPAIRALVFSEFDQMPYEMLRTTEIRIPADRLIDELWTMQGYPYQTIMVLMLGLTGDPAASEVVNTYIDKDRADAWANNIGAFAAALVELDGPSGVKKLSDRLLSDPAQPLDKLEEIVMALAAINRLADAEVQAAIDRALSDLVAQRPEAGTIVARQFATVLDWSQAAMLQPLITQRLLPDLTGMLTVSVYLAQARDAGAPIETAPVTDG